MVHTKHNARIDWVQHLQLLGFLSHVRFNSSPIDQKIMRKACRAPIKIHRLKILATFMACHCSTNSMPTLALHKLIFLVRRFVLSAPGKYSQQRVIRPWLFSCGFFNSTRSYPMNGLVLAVDTRCRSTLLRLMNILVPEIA